jgi:hypothetical protein
MNTQQDTSTGIQTSTRKVTFKVKEQAQNHTIPIQKTKHDLDQAGGGLSRPKEQSHNWHNHPPDDNTTQPMGKGPPAN